MIATSIVNMILVAEALTISPTVSSVSVGNGRSGPQLGSFAPTSRAGVLVDWVAGCAGWSTVVRGRIAQQWSDAKVVAAARGTWDEFEVTSLTGAFPPVVTLVENRLQHYQGHCYLSDSLESRLHVHREANSRLDLDLPHCTQVRVVSALLLDRIVGIVVEDKCSQRA